MVLCRANLGLRPEASNWSGGRVARAAGLGATLLSLVAPLTCRAEPNDDARTTPQSTPQTTPQSTTQSDIQPAAQSDAQPGTWAQGWSDPANYVPQSVWLNPGDLSYHFQRDEKFRGDNWGFGAQINFPHDVALLGGTFINSDRQRSYDAGVLWQPYSLGPVKLGAVAGGFNGYPYMKDGAWFPALLPMASVSYQRFGANVTIVPNYKNRLHGALVLQLIFKVW